jgi:hypothetical protein
MRARPAGRTLSFWWLRETLIKSPVVLRDLCGLDLLGTLNQSFLRMPRMFWKKFLVEPRCQL